MTEPASEWTSISVTTDEAARIKAFADPEKRTLRAQLLMWLEAAEKLYADITPEIQDKADTVKNKKLRVTEPED